MHSGARRDEIVEALLDAFPDPGDMEIVVGLADIGTRFATYRTAVGIAYEQALHALIGNYAVPQDQLMPLLNAARKKNPGNPKLRAVMDKLADRRRHQEETAMQSLCTTLQARDPAQGRFRAYRIDACTDLLGDWAVNVTYGCIGTRGRHIRSVLRSSWRMAAMPWRILLEPGTARSTRRVRSRTLSALMADG